MHIFIGKRHDLRTVLSRAQTGRGDIGCAELSGSGGVVCFVAQGGLMATGEQEEGLLSKKGVIAKSGSMSAADRTKKNLREITKMGSIGSCTRPEAGLLVGLIQFPVPIVNSRADIDKNVENIVKVVRATKAGYPGMELIVLPEYSTQGLNTAKWTTDEFLCDIPGPETDAFAKACKDTDMFGVFSIMERNHDYPGKAPYNTAIIIDNKGEIVLHYHKLNPWVPVEPWYPGNYGMPVCDGPGCSKLAVCICHDGMFPEVAREAAYKGANVLIRISGYSTQVCDQWILTNQSNAWHNLMYTISVNLAGYDGVFYYFGEGQICNFDGTTLQQGHRNPMEIVSGEIYPLMADQARRGWALENNIYDLGHRGFAAVPGGESECPYTFIKDFAAGKYKLPWEDEVKIKDGTFYGYPKVPPDNFPRPKKK